VPASAATHERHCLSRRKGTAIYFMEFLGTNPRAYIVRGARPCDPSTINWLD
jgi:hypothetical protein